MSQKGLTPIVIVLLIALGIAGYLLYQSQAKPITDLSTSPQLPIESNSSPIPQPTNSPYPIQSPSSDEISNWQTYSNQQYKFSFQYPDDWETVIDNFTNKTLDQNSTRHVSIGPKEVKGHGYDGYFGFTVYNKPLRSLEEVITEYGNQFSDRAESKENVTIGGQSALKVIVTTPRNPTWVSIHYIIETSNYIYAFGNGATISHKYVDFFDKIASTIKVQ